MTNVAASTAAGHRRRPVAVLPLDEQHQQRAPADAGPSRTGAPYPPHRLLATMPLDASVTLAIVGHLLAAQCPGRQPPPSPVPSGLVVDHEGREAWTDATLLDLTFLEFELLDFLVANPWKVFSRRQLLARVWRRGHDDDSRTVDVHVHRLRHKLGAQYGQCLLTVRHVGYKFIPPTAYPGLASPSLAPVNTRGREVLP